MALIRSNYFVVISLFHVCLVYISILLFNYHLTGDSLFYIEIAENLFSASFFDPVINWKFGIGYPLFIGLTSSIFSYNPLVVSISQSLFFCLIVFHSIKMLSFNQRTEKALFLFFCLCPNFIIINGMVMSEAIASTILLYIATLFFYKKSQKKSKIILSTCIAFCISIRYELVVIIFSLAALSFVLKRFSIKDLFFISIIPLVFLSLNAMKNQYVYGKFNPFGFSGGHVMYAGNNLNYDTSWHPHSSYKEYIPKEYIKEYESIVNHTNKAKAIVQLDSLFRHMANESWAKSPFEQIKVMPDKFLKTWIIPPHMDIYTMDFSYESGVKLSNFFSSAAYSFGGIIKHSVFILLHWVLIISIISGLYLARNDQKLFLISILVITISSLLYSTVLYGLPRFNSLYIPLLSLNLVYILKLFKFAKIKET